MNSQAPLLHLMFGGTFDPVHNGHLRMAVETRESLQDAVSGPVSIRLVPCHLPPHRGVPGASADQRCRMLAAAIEGEAGLILDRRELDRAEPSWSVETLGQLRQELGADQPLAMVVGTDAFGAIDRWHRWHEIFSLAHIIVLQRPGYRLDPETEAGRQLARRKAENALQLLSAPAGQILPLSLSLLEISATDIRNRVAAGRSPRYLLPDAVWRYICDYSLYTQ